MRRCLLTLTCSLLTALAAAVGPSAATAADDLASLTPEQVATRFVERLNARDPAVATCELLTRNLRDLHAWPALASLDLRMPDTYSEPNRTRSCDAFVGLLNGYHDDGQEPPWVRTEIGPAVVVEQSDTAVHLRIPVRRFFERQPAPVAGTADAFLIREDGAWKLASPSLLWEFGSGEVEGSVPATLAALPAYLEALARAADAQHRREQAFVGAYLATRAPLALLPLSWRGHITSTFDPLRDVDSRDHGRLADQDAPQIDLRKVSLRSDGETLTYELRFRTAPPAELGVSVSLWQDRHLTPRQRRRGLADTGAAEWSVWLSGGYASAVRGDAEEPEALRGLRASLTGNVLRLALPARVVRQGVRVGRPFRWTVSVRQRGVSSDPLGETWRDDAPARWDAEPRTWVLQRR